VSRSVLLNEMKAYEDAVAEPDHKQRERNEPVVHRGLNNTEADRSQRRHNAAYDAQHLCTDLRKRRVSVFIRWRPPTNLVCERARDESRDDHAHAVRNQVDARLKWIYAAGT